MPIPQSYRNVSSVRKLIIELSVPYLLLFWARLKISSLKTEETKTFFFLCSEGKVLFRRSIVTLNRLNWTWNLSWRTTRSVFVGNDTMCPRHNCRIYLVICSSIPRLGSDLTATKPPSIESLNTIISFLWVPEGHRGHTIWVSLEREEKEGRNEKTKNKTHIWQNRYAVVFFLMI